MTTHEAIPDEEKGKLSAKNFADWKDDCLTAFVTADAYQIVLGIETEPRLTATSSTAE